MSRASRRFARATDRLYAAQQDYDDALAALREDEQREHRWHSHSIDERASSTRDARTYLLYRRWWGTLRQRPRLLRCAVLGHRAVVGGTHGVPGCRPGYGEPSRWVECSRCDRRTDPHVALAPDAPLGSRVRGLGDAVEWSEQSIRLHYEIVMRRRWWREWAIGATLQVGGEYAIEISLYLGVVTLYLSASGLLAGLTRRVDYRHEPEIGLRLYRFDGTTCLTWDVWCDDNYEAMSGVRRRWWRHYYCHPIDKVLGRVRSEHTVVDAARGTVALPEAHYEATLTLTEYESWRPRWPGRRRWYRVNVKPDRPVPVPGNPDSDFYDGEDATHEMSTGCPYGPDEPQWIAHGLSQIVDSVLRDRVRHGGSAAWRPKDDAQTG